MFILVLPGTLFVSQWNEMVVCKRNLTINEKVMLWCRPSQVDYLTPVLGPSFKKKRVFPVERPGGNKCAGWGFFFLNFREKTILSKMSVFFQPKKKGKQRRICGCLSGYNFNHPLDRKQALFKCGLVDPCIHCINRSINAWYMCMVDPEKDANS